MQMTFVFLRKGQETKEKQSAGVLAGQEEGCCSHCRAEPGLCCDEQRSCERVRLLRGEKYLDSISSFSPKRGQQGASWLVWEAGKA